MERIHITPLRGALLGILAFMGLAASSHAVGVSEIPFSGAGTGTAVSISTSAWTLVPTASSLAQRSGVQVRNPSTNNASMLCVCDDASPSEAITIGGWEIPVTAGINSRFFWCDNNLKLYCVSLHTSAENINAKEYRQR